MVLELLQLMPDAEPDTLLDVDGVLAAEVAAPPTRHIYVDGILGDELFHAVAFLGAALELPGLLPDLVVDDVDIHDADTAELKLSDLKLSVR